MPQPNGILTSFQRRDTFDKLMFGWVRAGKRFLPGVSLEKSLEAFAHEFGLTQDQFNVNSQAMRYSRMDREFREDQRTPATS